MSDVYISGPTALPEIGDVGFTVQEGKVLHNIGETFWIKKSKTQEHSNDKPFKIVGKGQVIGYWYGALKNVPKSLYKLRRSEPPTEGALDSKVSAIIYRVVDVVL